MLGRHLKKMKSILSRGKLKACIKDLDKVRWDIQTTDPELIASDIEQVRKGFGNTIPRAGTWKSLH